MAWRRACRLWSLLIDEKVEVKEQRRPFIYFSLTFPMVPSDSGSITALPFPNRSIQAKKFLLSYHF